MKLNLVYYLLIPLYLISCNHNTPNTFILEGQIDGVADSTVLTLSYLTLKNNNWVEIVETTYIIDNKFTFKNEINELTATLLDLGYTYVTLYLEPVEMKLKINKDTPWEYKLSGTEAEPDNIILREKLKPNEEEYYKEFLAVHNIVEQLNLHTEETSKRDSLINMLDINKINRATIQKQLDQIRLDYIVENKASKINPHLIYSLAKNEFIEIDKIRDAYNSLPEKSKTSMFGRLAAEQIEHTEKVTNAKDLIKAGKAPDFSRTDISGKTIRLSDHYKENYILIDFWASWCKPCLAGIPQVRKINDRYKGKGLEIIGISLDDDTSKWINAIEKHNLDWLHILSKVDSDFFPDDISDNYGIESIPVYFLVDTQGNILSQWNHLGEEQLIELDNLLKKHRK